jgi:gas vesicle protein
MGNILIGAAIGIFVGAFAAELIHRKNPNALRGLGGGFSKVGNAVAKAFKDGYSGISETLEDATAPSAS